MSVAKRRMLCCACLWLIANGQLMIAESRTALAEDPQMEIWWADPLTQLLKDHQKEGTQIPGIIHAARGDVEGIQLAIRSKTPVHVKVRAKPFSDQIPVGIRVVGRVPITRGTHYTPPEERVALPPVDLPDPLYETSEMVIGAEETQSFWIDVFVPEETEPKEYKTWITVEAGEKKLKLQLRLQIYPVTIPFEGELLLTNWFAVKTEDMGFKDARIGDKDWWSCADLLFDSMWAHRQNMFWTPLREPWIQPKIGEEGQLLFDFTFFDRWVEAFSRPRGGKRKTYIEGQPITVRQGGYSGKIKASVWRIKDQNLKKRVIEADDPEAEQGYADFLIALQQHLRDKGWLNRFRLHICDEPHGAQLKPYGLIAGYVRKYAKDLCVMEALDVKDDFDFFEQNCDVWVPQLGRFNKTLPKMLERLDRGKEVWFYTCLWPNGKYPNRFVDYPLIKTRILQWINFKWGFTGYLHWGFNHWRGGDPFKVLEPHHGGQTYLPAGDAWIVYPGKKAVLDSMRHEAMRDSVEDYELLRLLEEKDPEQAKRLADSLIRSFEDYERDCSVFRAARIKLLNSFF